MADIGMTGGFLKEMKAANNSAENPDTSLEQRQKGQVNSMEDGRRKIWICLLVVVLAAVVIGVLYYYSAPQEQGSEGFLIRAGQHSASESAAGQQEAFRAGEETEKSQEAAYVF